MNTIKGTPYYIAPEVLKEVYDEKCDIWSCGVILYIMLCGYPPFNGESEKEIMKNVMKGIYDFPEEEWSCVSNEAKELVSKMLKYDPRKRFSAKECLLSNWIQKNQDVTRDVKLSQNALENLKKFKVKLNKKFLNFLLNYWNIFKADRKIEQATISFIVNQLICKEERNQLLSQFQLFDKDGDGVLTKEEIFQGYKNLYGDIITEDEVVRIK